MILVGKRSKAKYWGGYVVEDIVKLREPIKCTSEEKGEVDFNPTIIKIKWDKKPSDDVNELWFPYWITIDGKEKYGQFAPMLGQAALLELICGAIDKGFFNSYFLNALQERINRHISNNNPSSDKVVLPKA